MSTSGATARFWFLTHEEIRGPEGNLRAVLFGAREREGAYAALASPTATARTDSSRAVASQRMRRGSLVVVFLFMADEGA